MRLALLGSALLAGACTMAGLAGWGQEAPAQPATSSLDLAIAYDPVFSNEVNANGFWMQGCTVEVHGKFWHGLGVVADVDGVHSVPHRHTTCGWDGGLWGTRANSGCSSDVS